MTEYCVIRKDYLEELIDGYDYPLLPWVKSDEDFKFLLCELIEDLSNEEIRKYNKYKELKKKEQEYTKRILTNTLDGWRVVPEYVTELNPTRAYGAKGNEPCHSFGETMGDLRDHTTTNYLVSVVYEHKAFNVKQNEYIDIAAAPDMYEALKELMTAACVSPTSPEILEHLPENLYKRTVRMDEEDAKFRREIRKKAKQALAKAEGRDE